MVAMNTFCSTGKRVIAGLSNPSLFSVNYFADHRARTGAVMPVENCWRLQGPARRAALLALHPSSHNDDYRE